MKRGLAMAFAAMSLIDFAIASRLPGHPTPGREEAERRHAEAKRIAASEDVKRLNASKRRP